MGIYNKISIMLNAKKIRQRLDITTRPIHYGVPCHAWEKCNWKTGNQRKEVCAKNLVPDKRNCEFHHLRDAEDCTIERQERDNVFKKKIKASWFTEVERDLERGDVQITCVSIRGSMAHWRFQE